MDNTLTVKVVASKLCLNDETVYRWLRLGKLRGYKLGRLWRVTEDDLVSFLRGAESTHGRHILKNSDCSEQVAGSAPTL